MSNRPLQTYVSIMRVPVKSISVLHGQRQNFPTLTLQREHAYSFDNLSTALHDDFTILNKKG